MGYKVYESTEKGLELAANPSTPELLISKMDHEFLEVENPHVFWIVTHDDLLDTDICLFYGNASSYPLFREDMVGPTKVKLQENSRK